jgi:glycine betaine/proline transport system substrate-binding protein
MVLEGGETVNVPFLTRLHGVGRRGLALLAAALMIGAACGGDGAAGVGEEANKEIKIGVIPWDEDIAVTNLWEALLEERGYQVEQTQLEVGGLYSGVANGDLDLFMDAWLPATHEDYWAQFGSQIDDLTVWFENAPLTWVVPAYVEDVSSIEDLQGNGDMFGGKVVGIEAGSGLMRVSREDVIPAYDLGDEYEVIEGSTPAMLAELEKAISDKEPVLVTLWQPHWAYGKWDLKNLEDPKGALGEPDSIHILAREGFEDDFSEVAGWLKNFRLANAPLAQLEVKIQQMGEGQELAAARAWIKENRDLVDSWLKG